MKKLNFLMLAFTLLLGITFTSCLDSDDDSDRTGYAMVRCKSYMGLGWFEDRYGNQLNPTAASLLNVETQTNFNMSSTHLAMIQYRLVETEGSASGSADTNNKKYDIELLAAESLDGPAVVVANNAEEMATRAPETASVVTIKSSSFSYVPYVYDKETIFLPIVFRWSNESSMASQHKMVLACNLEDVTSGSKQLTFYLRHDRGTDEKENAVVGMLRGYDIGDAVSSFKAIAGNDPETVVLYVKETGEYSTAEPTELKKYTAKFNSANDSDVIFNVAN